MKLSTTVAFVVAWKLLGNIDTFVESASFVAPSSSVSQFPTSIHQCSNGSPKCLHVLSMGSSKSVRLNTNGIRIPEGTDDENTSTSTGASCSTTTSGISSSSLSRSRRALLATFAASAALAFKPSDAKAQFPLIINSKYSLSVISNTNSTNAASIRQPLKEGLGSPLFSKELATESCLLKLLPVKRSAFRKMEKELLYVSILRKNTEDGQQPTDKAFMDISNAMKELLTFIDNKRSNLEPVFNQDDSTAMTMMKSIQGEERIECLRTEVDGIIRAANEMDEDGVYQSQKEALRALSEVGEFMVDRFPFDVPTEGEFSYLPRLLGRSKVTFTISRPRGNKHKKGSGNGNGNGEDRDKVTILGNVTVLADGYAAPITAGNFVDLSSRNYYTGLPAKNMKKRLGVEASFTTEDPVAYDIANTVDKFTGEDGVVQRTLGNLKNTNLNQKQKQKQKQRQNQDPLAEVEENGTILTSMSIMGSYNEGFYDPLTAKPRRIPLEIVQFDRLTSTAKLSYESGFTSTSASGGGSGTGSGSGTSTLGPLGDSNLLAKISSPRKSPLLTYNIPGLVGMNHPDKNLNGGSSEFFVLKETDRTNDRTSLLSGKYAPFGYIMEGLDIMNELEAGDVISATYVDDWGQMNLKKIRGTSFADAMSSSQEEEASAAMKSE